MLTPKMEPVLPETRPGWKLAPLTKPDCWSCGRSAANPERELNRLTRRRGLDGDRTAQHARNHGCACAAERIRSCEARAQGSAAAGDLEADRHALHGLAGGIQNCDDERLGRLGPRCHRLLIAGDNL